jgi:internalin A
MNSSELQKLIDQAEIDGACKLDLREQGIEEIPDSIAKLTNLTVLDLRGNQITHIPDSILKLTNLKELNLSDNKISNIPNSIVRLAKLTHLFLFTNKISEIPQEISGLVGLIHLDIGDNRISDISEGITELINLEGLVLNLNEIQEIPDSIIQLKKLEILRLDGNQIKKLPNGIRHLSRLTWLNLDENPLPIAPEIIRKGWGKEAWNDGNPQSVLDAYFDLIEAQIKGKTRPLNEVKLLIVGQADVGKTSLMQRLITNTFDSEQAKTEGINIQNWNLPCNGTDIRLNLWDFGGQEIMHATHQFFLTERSLYLLVIDNRQDEVQNRVEHWLKMIQAFGSNSPIIIIGNQSDVHPLDLDKRTLHEKYPTLRAILATSCKNGTGLKELRQEITKQINQLPHVKDLFQISHFNIKSKLESMKDDFISYEKYQDLCIAEGIETEKEQKRLVTFLHDLGIVLNFQNDPRLNETNVLNPEWVTTGTYRIINNNVLMTRG